MSFALSESSKRNRSGVDVRLIKISDRATLKIAGLLEQSNEPNRENSRIDHVTIIACSISAN